MSCAKGKSQHHGWANVTFSHLPPIRMWHHPAEMLVSTTFPLVSGPYACMMNGDAIWSEFDSSQQHLLVSGRVNVV